ncbi:unnamed protein product [Heligmosomoides polygyrus]|uniref:N-acetylmuramoyl-L-alanine amidase n=1 Tax=Heligmosomoides polygyrus TaxID=6339 RepID=A0A3P8CRJ5_HELPZ|nr:unnamed protein product [Heligmosomoides polygyrus]
MHFALLLLTAVSLVTSQSLPESCWMCLDIVSSSTKQGSETEEATKQRALDNAHSYNLSDQTVYINELNCHWKKYYGDANSHQSDYFLTTCADTGMCPIEYQTQPSTFTLVDITKSTTNYNAWCAMPNIVLIHHTATATADETIDALNKRGLSVQYIVALNGTVYQQVADYHVAWHAGTGAWRDITLVNSNSVGIEIVNTGDKPYPHLQIKAVNELVRMLKERWFVDDFYIIGHSDITPARKDDPSGYFPWSSLYNHLSIFPNLFNTSLSESKQRAIIIGGNVTYSPDRLTQIQLDLQTVGYTYLSLTLGVYNDNTSSVFEAFNRHFSPEVFIKESVDPATQDTIHHEENRYWYGISHERLQKLISSM